MAALLDPGTTPQRLSPSSEISDLSSVSSIDERVNNIRKVLRQHEIAREQRRQTFLIRTNKVRERIDTLQKARIQRLIADGIHIDLHLIKTTLSKEAEKWKQKEEKEAEELIDSFNDNSNDNKDDSKEEKKDANKFNNEKFVFSVQDELAKLNKSSIAAKNKSKRSQKEKIPKLKVEESSTASNDAKRVDNGHRRQSLVLALAEENSSKELPNLKDDTLPQVNSVRERRRSSINVDRPLFPKSRRGSMDAMSPFLQRRKSSGTIEPPKWTETIKTEKRKPKKNKNENKEPPMWGDILKMGRENEKKGKKKKKSQKVQEATEE